MIPLNVYSRYDTVDEDIPLNEPNLIRVRRKNGTGYLAGFINPYGHEVVPCKYIAHDYSFKCGLLSITDQNEKIGYIDTMGYLIYECQFDRVGVFQDNLCGVAKWDGHSYKYGLIDNKGNVIIDFKYSILLVMGHNRLMAEDSPYRGVGLLDYQGNEVTAFKYKQLGHILSNNTLDFLLPNGEHGLMDINGNHLGLLPI